MAGTMRDLFTLLSVVGVQHTSAMCGQPLMSIETTTAGLTISGCYNESRYAGLYETTIYTIEGMDISDAGSTAILAADGYQSSSEPSWVIGTVVPNPANSWSDGYSAGLNIQKVMCVSNSTFWEAADPTDIQVWKCDADGDGIVSLLERGDFEKLDCGCPAPETFAPVGTTPAPVSISDTATPAPVGKSPTNAPVTNDRNITGTPAPTISGGANTTAALACNLTLASDTLLDVRGCFVGQASSNTRGRWVHVGGRASIEWKVPPIAGADGFWGIEVNGYGNGDELRCLSAVDIDNPSNIVADMWRCDSDKDGIYSADETGEDFLGLVCTGGCAGISDGVFDTGELESSSETELSDRPALVIAVGVIGALILGGAALLMMMVHRRRRKSAPVIGGSSQPPEPSRAPSSDTATADVPVFQPWGTRGPPKTYQ